MKLILLLALFMLPIPLSGQEMGKSGNSSIMIRMLAMVVPPELGKVYLISDDVRTPEFDIPVNNVSEPMKVFRRILILKDSKKDAILCNIMLPEEGKRFVIVLAPAKNSGYTAHVIRTDDLSFRKEDCFFGNFTHKSILGKLGTSKFLLESGKVAVYRPEGARSGNFYDIAFATRGAEGDRILSTSRWPVDNQIRSYVFFIEDPVGHISYRAIDEFVVKEK